MLSGTASAAYTRLCGAARRDLELQTASACFLPADGDKSQRHCNCPLPLSKSG